ncbi:MAG: carboxypeptidase regulatory-like domain-containing protein, partial [Oscillospiraceae bacterium]|nr:carboxypeptidase regulatory-like domain-containing protein [Oscillospiraceae bacterium]
ELPLGDVAVDIAPSGGRTVRETATDADGIYSALLREGEYTQTLEAAGYISAQREATVYRNEVTYMPALVMVPDSGGEGYISGRIVDALTGRGVPYADITLYNAERGSSDTFTADYQGDFEAALPAGYYSAQVRADGYTDTEGVISSFGSQSLYNQNLTLTPYLSEGEVRAVLTWGQYPQDLDSHLMGPRANGSRFHIYFENKTETENGTRMADLDLDDTDSYGPETTSIYVATPGVYSFVVHDYTNGGAEYSTALANSGAMVRVYIGGSQIREFSVPPYIVGDTWYVFDLVDGSCACPIRIHIPSRSGERYAVQVRARGVGGFCRGGDIGACPRRRGRRVYIRGCRPRAAV